MAAAGDDDIRGQSGVDEVKRLHAGNDKQLKPGMQSTVHCTYHSPNFGTGGALIR
jgi:hypothetical protein